MEQPPIQPPQPPTPPENQPSFANQPQPPQYPPAQLPIQPPTRPAYGQPLSPQPPPPYAGQPQPPMPPGYQQPYYPQPPQYPPAPPTYQPPMPPGYQQPYYPQPAQQPPMPPPGYQQPYMTQPPQSPPPPMQPAPAQKRPADPSAMRTLYRIATVVSILSTIAFVAFIFMPRATAAQQSHAHPYFLVGLVGLAIALVCQAVGILILIGHWASHFNTEKRLREILILTVSLFPFVVLVVCLGTLIVYLRARRKDPTSKETKQAKEDLKDKAADSFVDISANRSQDFAAGVAQRPPAASAGASTRPTMRDTVRRVIGPSTERSLSAAGGGLVTLTMIAVVLATIATLGAVTVSTPLGGKAAVGGVSHSKSHLPSGTTKLFALPNNMIPASIVGGPDGNVWFTGFSSTFGVASVVGYVTPSGTIHQFSIPQSAGFPTGSMAVGPDKALWFTLAFNGQPESTSIGRITTAGSFQAYQTPEGLGSYGNIHVVCGLTAGPDGNMWFSEQYTNNIGRISPSGSVTEFNDPSADGFPTSITAGPDGNLWFSDKDGIGKMTPSGGTTLYPFSTGALCLSGGPGGKVWFTDSNGNVDSITSGGQITTVATGVGGGCITTDSDGNLWFVGNGIERISSSGAAKSYPISGTTDTLQCLTAAPDGNIWFTTESQDGSTGSIGYVAP